MLTLNCVQAAKATPSAAAAVLMLSIELARGLALATWHAHLEVCTGSNDDALCSSCSADAGATRRAPAVLSASVHLHCHAEG